MRIVLLGGSFDPLHLGHVLLGAEALWRYEPDGLWLLPVAQHAFGKPLLPFKERFEMARLGAALLGPRAEAKALEAELVAQGGDGTTIALVRHLTAASPTTQFALAIGADAWAQRSAWREFGALAELAEVLVFNRAGSPLVEGAGPALPDISSTAIRERVRNGQAIEELVPLEIARYIRARGLYR